MSFESLQGDNLLLATLVRLCEGAYAREDWGNFEDYEAFESVRLCREIKASFESVMHLMGRDDLAAAFCRFDLPDDVISASQVTEMPIGLSYLTLAQPFVLLSKATENFTDYGFKFTGDIELPYLDLGLLNTQNPLTGDYNGPHIYSLFDTSVLADDTLQDVKLRPGIHPALIAFREVRIPDYAAPMQIFN